MLPSAARRASISDKVVAMSLLPVRSVASCWKTPAIPANISAAGLSNPKNAAISSISPTQRYAFGYMSGMPLANFATSCDWLSESSAIRALSAPLLAAASSIEVPRPIRPLLMPA